MGNSLCKERIERADNSKSPVDRVIGRCSQICPNSFASKKTNSNYWKNQVLETSPPTRTQPKSNDNEWRTVTLNTVPQTLPQTNQQIKNLSDVPIPPPRKKRNTLQIHHNGQPGGFKEVFGTPTRRSSCDSLEKFTNMDTSPNRRNSSGDIHSDEFTDFSKDSSNDKLRIKRKISKVGNKKSDKFLGENLSSCLSYSPFLASTPILAKKADDLSTTIPKDALDTFVDSNVSHHDLSSDVSKIIAEHVEHPQRDILTTEVNQSKSAPIQMHIQYSKEPDERPSLVNAVKIVVNDFQENVENLDKKAEFLMTMLDGHDFETCDVNTNNSQQPDELVTVPKRRRSKNIASEDVAIVFQPKVKHEVVYTIVQPTTMSNQLTTTSEEISNKSSQSESIAQPIELTESAQIDAVDRKLKLELSLPEKKKEFPKSNPDSPNIYAHLKPVEHELIVPIRKNYKHICDDDEHIKHKHNHSHSHKHSTEALVDEKVKSPNLVEHIIEAERNIIQENVSPKKPDRDFTRYRKSEDLSVLEEPEELSMESLLESQILRPVRKKGRSISRDSLPSPPPRPIKLQIDRKISLQEPIKPTKSRKISLQEPKRGLFEDQKLPDSPVTPINKPILNDNEYEKIETFLKKCSSSQSFLTKELMDQLVDKVYGYSRNWDDQMEEGMLHTKCNDGSENVGPSSKLTTRKISVIKKDTPNIIQEEPLNSETEEIKKPTFSIGSSDIIRGAVSTTPIPEESPFQSETTPSINNSSHIKRTDTVLELLVEGTSSEKDVQSKDSTSQSSQSENMSDLKQSATFTESNPDLDAVKVLLKSTDIHQGSETNVLKDIYKRNQVIMDDFKDYLEDKKINEEMMNVANTTKVKVIIDEETDVSKNLFPDHISLDSFNDTNDSDDDSDKVPLTNKRLKIAEEPRRGSIVEHDQWFLKHRDLSNQGRRGSEGLTTYDTRKLFPFGKREKTYSESSEFFDDEQKKSKSWDHINLDSSSELDHSTLLKYFDKKNLNNPNK